MSKQRSYLLHYYSILKRTRTINNTPYRKQHPFGVHYVLLHSSPAGMKYGRTSGSVDVTNDISERLLRLSMFYGMIDDELDRVLDGVNDFYNLT